MTQELMAQASQLEQQFKQLNENLEFIDSEAIELEKFKQSIRDIENSHSNETLSSIGKGIHIKTELKSKELFVEVGSGVVVKKTPEQTLNIIDSQIKKLRETREQLLSELEHIKTQFQDVIGEINSQTTKSE